MGDLDERRALRRRRELIEMNVPAMNGVLDIVHGIGHVVGPVHDLLFEAGAIIRRSLAKPMEDRQVIVIDTELAHTRLAFPRVLAGGIE